MQAPIHSVSIKDSYGSTATANVTVTVNVSTDPLYVNAGIGEHNITS